MTKLRLLIVEDNPLLREGMAALLNQRSDFTVVASGDSSFDVKKARHINPDVVLVDLGLRNRNSLHVVETVRKASPSARVILMDLLPVQEDLVEYVKVGVSGFVLKDATLADFVRTIHAVADGTTVLPEALAGTLFSEISKRFYSKILSVFEDRPGFRCAQSGLQVIGGLSHCSASGIMTDP